MTQPLHPGLPCNYIHASKSHYTHSIPLRTTPPLHTFHTTPPLPPNNTHALKKRSRMTSLAASADTLNDSTLMFDSLTLCVGYLT